MSNLAELRAQIDKDTYAPERALREALVKTAALTKVQRAEICRHAADLVAEIRSTTRPGLMEVFLAEYGLSTDEGVELMCLAEALLRVPDAETIDALIEDKIAPSDWGRHLGRSTSPLVNASTWALMLTGKVLADEQPGPVGHLRGAIKRLGEPVIRAAVGRAMKEMGAQFVLGETIDAAMARGAAREAEGYGYSYDMLGEAARTEDDAARYHLAYARAIGAIAKAAKSDDPRDNPGISVKLSALYPRYEEAKRDDVMAHLMPRLRALAVQAKSARIGLNVDAEEADRLSLSLDVIEAVLAEPDLAGWSGFGVVVQAYGQRAGAVIDWLGALAAQLDRKIMVRLVKGAYWDTEIKRAQVEGLDAFPVLTEKSLTDISYIANARKLLSHSDRIYAQFATHNAHTVAAILHMAEDVDAFEFQRLHGMGETLHEIVKAQHGTRCRIYAPVGAHRDLLAYLVRRLLENGANSSFVNQLLDPEVPPTDVARDPFEVDALPPLPTGVALFAPERVNSRGLDLSHRPTIAMIDAARAPHAQARWQSTGRLATGETTGAVQEVRNPANPDDVVGTVRWASAKDVAKACEAAEPWGQDATTRKAVLERAAKLYEDHYGALFALLHREAGKTVLDAQAELREAVDFLRYYAGQTEGAPPVGRFACISPWNFPLAIFTGQIAAALAAGNAVLAKPAEQTPLIADYAVGLLLEAGVPATALQLLPGDGATGAALTSDPRVDGVAFTGSTATAQAIHRAMAQHLAPGAPLIAETGGLNAMIVDSTALPEQVVQAVVESAFQSAGQRCSALRCLYVQSDIAEGVTTMLRGAMQMLEAGNPWDWSCDLGPVIDADAATSIRAHIEAARAEGRVLEEGAVPKQGHYIAPTLIEVAGIADLREEVFGPVLHIATFEAEDLDRVIADINATGYGLTFGLQSRIDDRVQGIADKVHAGNIYVNRNQIGAIVGSQPFGGEGLSGTGPKAGGPLYVDRFRRHDAAPQAATASAAATRQEIEAALHAAAPGAARQTTRLPGPTGEANLYSTDARAPILCLGPGAENAAAQKAAVEALGGRAVAVEGIEAEELTELSGLSAVIWWGDDAQARALRLALAARNGAIIPLITGMPDRGHARAERHVCIDTTATGGNAELLDGSR